jgi:hypothetical protein
MSYIVILMSFTAIFPSIGYGQGNPLNWKGTFAPLAPPGKGQRGRLPLLPPQFRRPWFQSLSIVFVCAVNTKLASLFGLDFSLQIYMELTG